MAITAPWSAPRVTHARAGLFPAMTGGALAALRRLVAAPSAWFPTNDERLVPDAAQDGHQGERAAAVPAAR